MSNRRIANLLAKVEHEYLYRSPSQRKRFFQDLRALVPYCIQKLKSEAAKPDKWLVLNRDYKPLGVIGNFISIQGELVEVSRCVDYENFRDDAVTFTTSPETATDTWDTRQGDCLYISGDGTDARTRLHRISSLRALIAENAQPYPTTN